MTVQTIMIVEDDPEIREITRLYLVKNGYRVVWADSGDDALSLMKAEQPDLVILDVLLPGKTGFAVCEELRAISSVPILFLSCMREEADKVAAFNLGGDDFITKPFSPNELIARVRAHLRRPYLSKEDQPESPSKLFFGPLAIDGLSRVVKVDGQEVPLSRKEFDLLYYLASNPGRTYTHEQLFRQIWGQESFNDTRTIIVHVSNLRKKIEPDPSCPQYIINVHGVGYKFMQRGDASGEAAQAP
ncbi:response regulator transcription factor [Paenibacillus puerhi]|uniref:response regulator transcription factor n=1 Tax=Paenibacillus puerhi TaxID=2692622 RepID=UPI00135A5D8A|nr:response regulator transcription factor [Paenibacillus puerhi]